ncbi:RNA polymerase sigma-70 factor [Dysgonomonas sp. OttesenSCG-928-M03]|nr:RNA polymerase sigma-70 factor [Dysgonomonas sp. OttesenSCG-928-M03]
MINDLFVLKRIKEGDIKAFENVFRSYYTPLCFYAASITRRMEIAEDIVQELFYVIWKDRESLTIYRTLKGYLYSAVHNRALQHEEHIQVQQRHRNTIIKKGEESDSTPEEQFEYKELEKLIDNTLGNMPERRRKIFNMNRIEKKKYSEIAEILSISVKTVEAEMTKALKTLRSEIESYTNTL